MIKSVYYNYIEIDFIISSSSQILYNFLQMSEVVLFPLLSPSQFKLLSFFPFVSPILRFPSSPLPIFSWPCAPHCFKKLCPRSQVSRSSWEKISQMQCWGHTVSYCKFLSLPTACLEKIHPVINCTAGKFYSTGAVTTVTSLLFSYTLL